MTTKTVREVLTEARGLISKNGGWARHVLAKDKHGHPVHPTSPSAVCWCAVGAIAKAANVTSPITGATKVVYNDPRTVAACKVIQDAACDTHFFTAASFVYCKNDEAMKVEQVLPLFDAGIKRAEEKCL